jgi:hypothetical protein
MAVSGLEQFGADIFNPMYGSAITQNQNARAQNATNDKWAPLLALNNSKGAANVPVKSADMSQFLMPMLSSLFGAVASSGGGGDSSGGGGGGGGSSSGMGAASGALAGLGEGMSSGGKIPHYDNGGGISGITSMISSILPFIAMLASKGGSVPGQANVMGDSPANDTKLIAASPGEVVLPRTVAKAGMNGNKWKVAAYLSEVKKHGPGPMPSKLSSQPKASSSMSPWAAMCSGGKA